MDLMAVVGDRLYVSLQRLDINSTLRLPATNGAIAVIDTHFAGGALLGNDRGVDSTFQLVSRIAFFAYAAVAFIPNIWNAANFARFDAEKRSRVAQSNDATNAEDVRDDDAEAMGALVATLVVAFIGVLAYIAGGIGSSVAFENFYGLVLCGAVIGTFVIVVFLDWIAETPLVRALSRMLRAVSRNAHILAAFYNWIDTGLVRIGASVAGMGQETTPGRYVLLGGTLLCLTILAWYLPPPLGLAPTLAGFLLAISVSRLWSWVEDDRALAAMTDFKHNAPYRIGFREDFREEALLGFIFVFTLLPIAMMQAHEGNFFGSNMFVVPENTGFLGWFGFFGVELAKAVPIVDWAEIYEINPAADLIQFKSAAAKHSVFLARVMVDMVLIASLLQVVGIATRNRQQKRLLKRGHIKRLDEFVERTELGKAISVTLRRHAGAIRTDLKGEEAAKHFNLAKLGHDGVVDFRRYDRDRLFHIYGSTTGHLEWRAFIAAIAHQAGFQLLHSIELTQKIAESGQDEPAMYATFQRALDEHRQGVRHIDAGDIFAILSPLRPAHGLRDFKCMLVDKAVEFGTPEEALDKLKGLAIGPKADSFKYTRNRIAEKIVYLAPRITEVAVLEAAILDWANTHNRPSDQQYIAASVALENALKDLNRRLNKP
jgi:hypothetical protein